MKLDLQPKNWLNLTEIKNNYGRIEEYAKEFGLTYLEGQQPWAVAVDIALPCATKMN